MVSVTIKFGIAINKLIDQKKERELGTQAENLAEEDSVGRDVLYKT